MSRFKRATLTVVVAAALAGTLAPAPARAADVPGSHDHPLVSRYAGSEIIGYDTRDFDEYGLLVRKVTKSGGKAANPEAAQRLEGRITRITYRVPPDRSTLEVFRNYQGAMAEAGFEVLFECADEACGGRSFNHAVVPYDLTFGDNYDDQRYEAAKLPREEGDVYVALYVVRDTIHTGATGGRVSVQLDLIETKPMESGMVTVDAAAMAKQIGAEGHVALYGIYFDFDKADVKPESKPALDEIAKLLKEQPALKIWVVGHTDNVGEPGYNLDLSRRRARSVVHALTGEYGVAPARLQPEGVGMLAPVATNKTEEGRALNRRVELVER